MSLLFGLSRLTVSGVAVARLQNVSVNITYDNALMRGDNRIFADDCQLYNGAIEGNWEMGELNISAISTILGGTASVAAGSGTWTLSATQFPASGVAIVFSGVTDGVTCTITLKSVKITSFSMAFDRENYLMPAANFVCVGDAAADDLITIQL